MATPSPSGSGNDSDQDFDPSAEMLVNDFDDEHTLDEEEALGAEDSKQEIDELHKEGNMPIEELLALYGYGAKAESEDEEEEAEAEETEANADKKSAAAPAPGVASSSRQTQYLAAPTRKASAKAMSMSDSSDESDSDESANEGDWRRTIQVGSDYQASIPAQMSKEAYEKSTTTVIEVLLWKPVAGIREAQINDYLIQYAKVSLKDELSCPDIALPSGAHIKDDEQALYVLMKCKYNFKEAVKLHENANEPRAPISEMMTAWSEEECRAFESGLRCYGKNFFMIKHNKVATRTVGEVVQFYYFWKKTERHDMFANKFRIEKKRDFMNRFLDEQEASTNNTQQHQAGDIMAPIGGNFLLGKPDQYMAPQQQQQQQQQSSGTPTGNRNTMSLSTIRPNQLIMGQRTGGQGSRTINVSASGEPQTILINDFPPTHNKQSVVITGHASSPASSRNLHGHSSSSAGSSSSSNTTTIMVGKNPIVIDGNWVSNSAGASSASQGAHHHQSNSSNTQSVSIIKLSNNKSGNMHGHHHHHHHR